MLSPCEIPVAVSPPSDLLSLISDQSSHISSVVGVGIKNDDVDDIGLCCSSTGLHTEPPQVNVDSLSDDVKVVNVSLSPEAKLDRQPVPMPLSTLPLHAVVVVSPVSAGGAMCELMTDSHSAWSDCGNCSVSPSQCSSTASSAFSLAGCTATKCKTSLLLMLLLIKLQTFCNQKPTSLST